MFNDQDIAIKHGTSSTIGVGTWMAFDCLQLLNIIPILGSIAVLVILIVMACSSQTAPSMKNRIIANFVWLGIAIIAWIIVFFILMATGMWAYVMNKTSLMGF